MDVKRHIFVSRPEVGGLDSRSRQINDAILEKLQAARLDPVLFFQSPLTRGRPWNVREVANAMRRCQGAVVVGLARWDLRDTEGGDVQFASEYCHVEGAIAGVQRLPVLAIAERSIGFRGFFAEGNQFVAR